MNITEIIASYLNNSKELLEQIALHDQLLRVPNLEEAEKNTLVVLKWLSELPTEIRSHPVLVQLLADALSIGEASYLANIA